MTEHKEKLMKEFDEKFPNGFTKEFGIVSGYWKKVARPEDVKTFLEKAIDESVSRKDEVINKMSEETSKICKLSQQRDEKCAEEIEYRLLEAEHMWYKKYTNELAQKEKELKAERDRKDIYKQKYCVHINLAHQCGAREDIKKAERDRVVGEVGGKIDKIELYQYDADKLKQILSDIKNKGV